MKDDVTVPDRHVRRIGEDYGSTFLTLLPQGQAWPKYPGSTLDLACRGIAEYWGFVDGRAADLLEIESDPRKTTDAEFNPPDFRETYLDPNKTSAYITLSNNNLTARKTIAPPKYASTFSLPTRGRQMYFEYTIDLLGDNAVGISNYVIPDDSTGTNGGWMGSSANSNGSIGFWDGGATGIGVWYANAPLSEALPKPRTGDVIAVAIDRAAQTVTIRNITREGEWSSPYSIASLGTSDLFVGVTLGVNPDVGETKTFNFDGPFVGAVPVGFTRVDGTVGRPDGLLLDWERNWELPDPCETFPPDTQPDRREELVFKMTLLGAQDRNFFKWLAERQNQTVTIREYAPYMCGISRVGDTRSPLYGDDPAHFRWQIGREEIRFYWLVDLENVLTGVECIFSRYKPGHTDVVFTYRSALDRSVALYAWLGI